MSASTLYVENVKGLWYYCCMTSGDDKKKDVVFIDLFDPRQPRSDRELIEARLEVCNSCEWLDKRITKCRKCGCFMKLKTTLKQAHCPLEKW